MDGERVISDNYPELWSNVDAGSLLIGTRYPERILLSVIIAFEASDAFDCEKP